TLLLLRHLLRHPEPVAMLVLGTYRRTELSRTHPMTELLADLRREAGFTRVPLDGLSVNEVAQLLVESAGTPHEQAGALADALCRDTDGNPYFVSETLRHLRDADLLRSGAGGWAEDLERTRLDIPEGIRE